MVRAVSAYTVSDGGTVVFGPLGVPEMLLIFVVALLLFGPRRMPDIGRSIGRAMAEFRRASNEFKRTIEDEVAADDLRQVEKDLKEVHRATDELRTPFRQGSGEDSGGGKGTPQPESESAGDEMGAGSDAGSKPTEAP